MNHNRRPIRYRRTVVPTSARPVRYGAYAPYPGTPMARPRRDAHRVAEFIEGWLIGFGGGAVVVVMLALALLIVAPPRRTNILLLGLDRRPQETSSAARTDTMILLTIYPQRRYVGMLSIPRDLYLPLPGGFSDRINTAYFYAEAEQPGSGPAAAMEAVRTNFGVHVDHYVRIDLAGFVQIVDALGGIDIDVPAPLFDDAYPTYDYGTTTVSFAAGPQHMDGDQALAYARIRHGSSDFQRAERQQLVIEAVIGRLLQPTAWVRLPAVAAAARQSIGTDLGPLDLLAAAPVILAVGPSNIDRAVIEGDMVQPYVTDGGADVQLPVWTAINPVLLKMFGQ
jgi:polyisoprenyl-teichoic acid--peptidoglycan teichoic acid transferase